MKETVEREVKLNVGPGFRMPALPGAQAQPPRTFTSVYFDTNDHRLAGLGITLRRRVEKRLGLWQLKLPHGNDRLEIEAEGPAHSPPSHLADLLLGVLRGHSLSEVARLRTRRATLTVRENRKKVADVVADHVTVLREGKSSGTFKEVEIELTGGGEEHLTKLEEALLAAGATASDGRPKLLRILGFEPAQPGLPGPDSGDLVHLHAMIRAQTNALIAHDPGARLGRDPEDLHQLRVATRRLRSVLRTARDLLETTWAEDLRAELAWVGEVSGKARDRDVMVDNLAAQIREMGAGAAGGAPILTFFQKERKAAREELIEAMHSERYMKLLGRLEEASESLRVRPEAPSLMEAASTEFKKLRKAMKNADDSISDEELHKIRIQGKRARYAGELVEGIIGGAASKFISKAKVFQDALGEHQDCIFAEAEIRRVPAVNSNPDTAFIAGRMVERLRLRRESARASMPKVWKPLEKLGVRIWQ